MQGDASRAFEGTGLGLAMVKSCVALLGGTLGSTRCPAAARASRASSVRSKTLHALQEQDRTTGTSRRRRRCSPPRLAESAAITAVAELATSEILVVDDNPTNLEVMRELLRSAGYPVVTCRAAARGSSAFASRRPICCCST